VGVPKKPTGFFFGYVPGCLNPVNHKVAEAEWKCTDVNEHW